MFSLTKYKSKTDNSTDQYCEVNWPEFVKRMSDHEIRRQKDGPAFSAVEYAYSIEGFRFDGPIFKPGTNIQRGKVWINKKGEKRVTDMQDRITRANENVISVSMAALDVDQGTIGQVREKLKDFNHLIHTTFSHTAEKHKFRVIIPFKVPIPASDYQRAWVELNQLIGGVADKSVHDPARLNFLPSCPPETAPARQCLHSGGGKFYFLKTAPKATQTVSKKKKPKIKRGDYRTLDVVQLFVAHRAYNGPTGKANQHWVDCPWKENHTGAKQGSTDTCIYTDNTENWPTFHCSHNHCAEKSIKDVISLWGDVDKFCAKEATPETVTTDVVIRALGHDESGRFYYQCNKNNNIVALRANEHRDLNFYSISADPDYWYKKFGNSDDGKINWKTAAISMMSDCQKIGFFHPSSVRGGGVWEDDDRIIVHLGKKLLVDGVETPITAMKSDHIYEAMVRNIELPPPLPDEESSKIVDIIRRLPIATDAQRMILAGEIVCGMLSGVLTWRPHVWLTGKTESGKSSILTHLVNRLWSPMGGIYSEERTTEAGVRQRIRHNAVPVIIDEVEANQKDEVQRIQKLIGLARSSSSDTTANVLKGTVNGMGFEFTVKACFLLSSIAHSLEWGQDKGRFSLVQMKMSKEASSTWLKLKKEMKATFTKEYALGLYCRCITNFDVIQESIEVFHQALLKLYPDSTPRWRDQLGTLLAGASSLLTEGVITSGYAEKVFTKVPGWEEAAHKDETDSSVNALKILFSHLIQHDGVRYSIGEKVMHALDPTHQGAPQPLLQRYGLLVKDEHLYIASDHPQTKHLFQQHGITGHYGLLALMEGAETGFQTEFGSITSKSVRVPIRHLKKKVAQENFL